MDHGVSMPAACTRGSLRFVFQVWHIAVSQTRVRATVWGVREAGPPRG